MALAYAGSVDTFAAAVAGSMTAVAKENVVLATHRWRGEGVDVKEKGVAMSQAEIYDFWA